MVNKSERTGKLTMEDPATMKMKALEERSGVSRESIRFYIREGILPEPDRPKPNIAYYSDLHVKRLLAIRYMRQEREMSLARIKSILVNAEFDSVARPTTLKGLKQLLPVLVDGTAPAEDKSIADIAIESGISETEINDIADCGIIEIREQDGDQYVGFRDVIILKQWGLMKATGFTQDKGYDLDLLRLYQQTMMDLAKFEIAQFFAGFGSDAISDEVVGKAAKGIDCVNTIIHQIHTKLLLKGIKRD
ncbi:MAG: MerR family transcriptional regulator [bacterium]